MRAGGPMGAIGPVGEDKCLAVMFCETDVVLGPMGAGEGALGALMNLLYWSRLTVGGRFGFRGMVPGGGRGLLRGTTSPSLLCL